MKKLLALVLLAMALPLGGLVTLLQSRLAERHAEAQPGRNVILLTIDFLRPEDLAASEMPVLGAFAEQNVYFEQMFTNSPLTLPAHVSMLSGWQPFANGVRDDFGFTVPDDIPWLPAWARAEGIATGAVCGSAKLAAGNGIERGFDDYDAPRYQVGYRTEALPPMLPLRPAESVMHTALDWIVDKHDGGSFFLMINLADLTECWPFHGLPEAVGAPEQRYRQTLASIDEQVGLLLQLLRGLNIDDRTLLIVTAPQADARDAHGELGAGNFVYDSTLHVPLIVSAPDQVPGRTAAPASPIDVMPTALRFLKPGAAAETKGQNLLRRNEMDNSRALYFETARPTFRHGAPALYGLRWHNLKWIDGIEPELYDLRYDPGEEHNLGASDSDLVESVRLQMDELIRRHPGSSAPALAVEPGRLPGRVVSRRYSRRKIGTEAPLHFREVYYGLGRVSALSSLGDRERALQLINDLELRSPGQPRVLSWQATLREQLNDADGARGAWEKLAKAQPDALEYCLGLGDLAVRAGTFDEAAGWYERAALADPVDFQARWARADCAYQAGKYAEAATFFAAAAELQPNRPEPESMRVQCLLAQGDFNAAAEMAETELKRFGPDTGLLLGLAQARLGLNDPTASRDALLRGLKIDERKPELYQYLAVVYYQLNQLDLAGAYADQCLEEIPDNQGMVLLKQQIQTRKEEE